jgi:DNA (cytosine-5)-methyltransferase 1
VRDTRPVLLDLFCKAGGAARGYQRAGFYVVGVDIEPQPRYAGDEFVQADALTFPLDGFDAIHASPPCQRYSAAAEIHDSAGQHPDLIPPIRARLRASGLPWVMENVARAPLDTSLVLCGSMFGLGVRRHRHFESSVLILAEPCGSHDDWYASVFGGRCVGRQRRTYAGPGLRQQTWDKFNDELATASRAMGIGWMTLEELGEAIPPAYTEHIGLQFMRYLEFRSAA